jgi:transposase
VQRFARGLVEDRTTVEVGLTLERSNGQAEVQVNKLELLRRRMFGRAHVALLWQRMLQAT